MDEEGLARFGFGPIYRFTGGPADRVLLPGGLMKQGAMLSLTLRGTQTAEGKLERLQLRRLETKAR